MIKKASFCRVFCNPLPLKDPSLLCSPTASVGEARLYFLFELMSENNRNGSAKRRGHTGFALYFKYNYKSENLLKLL